jgi:PAS domain S-box-containing protein
MSTLDPPTLRPAAGPGALTAAIDAAAMQARQSQLAAVVESAMDAIVSVDATHRVVVFNHAAAHMFGVPAEQALGQPLDRFLPQASRAAHAGHMADFAAAQGPARPMGRVRSLSGVRADGTEFPIEATIAVSGDGPDRLLTAVVRDASSRHHAELALREKQRAEEANRAKSEFLSRVSHELRTPLNAILGFARLMESDAEHPLPHAQRQRAEMIRLSGARLLDLVNDLLDLTKIEQGFYVLRKVPVHLGRALAQATELMRPEAQRRGLTIDAAEVDPDLHGLADARALDQVLLNLLSNAVKYNRDGGRIRLATRRQGRDVVIEVEDTGPGIAPDRIGLLFQPFNRLGAEGGAVAGTGLGLAISRQLARLMGGDLRAASRMGQGTRMTLTLRATRRTAPAPAPDSGMLQADWIDSLGGHALYIEDDPVNAVLMEQIFRRTAPAPAPDSGMLQADWIDSLGGHALYIEDDPVNAVLMEQIFRRTAGWSIDIVDTAQGGLELAAQRRYDLVLTDMNLPDLSGLEVISRLRAQSSTARHRIVAVSADALPHQIDAAFRAGANDYWTKPLDPSAVVRMLRGSRRAGG